MKGKINQSHKCRTKKILKYNTNQTTKYKIKSQYSK